MVISEFFFPKKKIITIDIGSRFIKGAHFVVKNKRPVLTSFEMIACPVGVFQKGMIVEQHEVSKIIEKLLKKINWKITTQTALCISGIYILTKKMDIPKSEKEIIRESIKFEAAQYLPYELSECSYEYRKLPGLNQDPDMESYFFVAANKNSIYTYNSIMRNISVKTALMTADFFCLQNSFQVNSSDVKNKLKDQFILLLDIGFQKTGFHIVYNYQTIFSRSFAVGVKMYVNALENELGISNKEANQLMDSMCKGENIPNEAMSIVQSYHSAFCKEISTGIEYYLNYFPNHSIQYCYIIGGGRHIPNIQKEIKNHFKMPVKEFSAFRKIQTKGFSKKKLISIQSFSNICIGLAIGLLDK